jgi:drug/metabolite transporter (DMT)-like permease
MLGCVCFLMSGHLAMLDVGHGRVRILTHEPDWWIAAVNQIGSILFLLAGLAAFVRPATSEPVNVGLVNWGTFAGAVCFAVAGVLQVRVFRVHSGTTTGWNE